MIWGDCRLIIRMNFFVSWDMPAYVWRIWQFLVSLERKSLSSGHIVSFASTCVEKIYIKDRRDAFRKPLLTSLLGGKIVLVVLFFSSSQWQEQDEIKVKIQVWWLRHHAVNPRRRRNDENNPHWDFRAARHCPCDAVSRLAHNVRTGHPIGSSVLPPMTLQSFVIALSMLVVCLGMVVLRTHHCLFAFALFWFSAAEDEQASLMSPTRTLNRFAFALSSCTADTLSRAPREIDFACT